MLVWSGSGAKNKAGYADARYAYKADHVMRAALVVSLAINAGQALLNWVLIGLMRVVIK